MELKSIFVLLLIFIVHSKVLGGNTYSARTVPKTFTNVTVAAGQTAILNCELDDSENETIIWMRDQGNKLISSGLESLTTNNRFKSFRHKTSGKLKLKILDAQKPDSGFYQWIIGGNSSIRAYVHLNVNRPIITLFGISNEMYIRLGQSINFNCIVEIDPSTNNRIIWFHNEQEIHYDRHRLGWNEFQKERNLSIGTLQIREAVRSDQGLYYCIASNYITQNIFLHIITATHNRGIVLTGFGSLVWLSCVFGSYVLCYTKYEETTFRIIE